MAASNPVTPTSAANLRHRIGARLGAVPSTRWIAVAALALIAAQLVQRSVYISQSWFLVDDFRFLQDISLGHDDASWYLRIHQGHFMPLSFVLVKIVSLFGVFNWTAVTIQILLLQAAASFACWWMLRTVFGTSRAVLPLLAFYLFAPLTMPSIMWWAVAINQLPHQIALCGALGAHVLYLRSRQWRHLALTTLFLSLGFVTYAKSLLIPVVLVVITVAWFGRGNGVVRWWRAFREHLAAWVLYGAVSAAFVVAYLNAAPVSERSQWSKLFELSERTTLETFGTTIMGGPWNWRLLGDGPISYTAAPDLLIIVSWLVIISAIAWAWATRIRALRALWLPGIYLAFSILLVWTGRGYTLDLLGPSQVSQHLQYISDAAPVLTFAIGAMFLPIKGAPDACAPRASPLVTFQLPRLLLVGLAAIFLAGSVLSSSKYAEPWANNFVERSFTTEAMREIRTNRPVLADTAVPSRAFSALLTPHHLIKNYFSLLRDDLDVRDVGTDMSVLNLKGEAVPADVDAGPRTDHDAAKPCPIVVADKVRTITFAPVIDFQFWMAIDYSANFGGDVVLTVAGKQQSVPIEQGAHRLLVATDGSYDRIQIRPLVDQQICVKSVRIGQLVDPGTL